MIRNTRFVAAFSLLTAVLTSMASAEAAVRVFRVRQAPVTVNSTPTIGLLSAGIFGALSRGREGSAKGVVYRFLSENRATFGIQNPGNSTLPLVKTMVTDRGVALRFAQIANGIPVHGAELIALFNANGDLKTINSSLKPLSNPITVPEISREEAFAIAAREFEFENAELGNDEVNDGLKVIASPDGEKLVWQVSLREGSDGARAMQVQVIAAGPKKGEILESNLLGKSISGDITIYDASITIILPNPIYKGVKVLKNGKKRGTGYFRKVSQAKAAHKSLTEASDYFLNTFKRDSYDGQGAPLVAAVNVGRFWSKTLDPLGMKQNAAWIGPWKMFAIGAGGTLLGSFTSALDVIAHEFTHAVVSTTANLANGKQPGALNEHLADLFGAAAERQFEPSENPFLIGEKCLRGKLLDPNAGSGGLRDMLDPHQSLNVEKALEYANAPDFGQPSSMSEVPQDLGPECVPKSENDSCGVHSLNGIPNRAMALAILDSDWESVMDVAYRVMTTRLLSESDFANYRDQLLDECKNSASPTTCEALRKGFETVEL